MKRALSWLAWLFEQTNKSLGHVFSWFILLMVLLTFANVILRYAFKHVFNFQSELVIFMHGMSIMGAAGYTLFHDDHVRVDVFYQHFSNKTRAFVNLLGTLLCLFPMCFMVMYFSKDFVLNAWKIFEASSEYFGMPGVFVLKTFVWVFSITLFLQGLSIVYHSYRVLTEPASDPL